MSAGAFFGNDRCKEVHHGATRGRSWESISGAAHTPGWEKPRPPRSNWLRSEWSGFGGGQRADPYLLNISPNEPPRAVLCLWDPGHATPTDREGDYRVSRTRYGKPVGVWKAALTRGRGFTFDLGAERSSERESWRTYAPETDHERRTRANDVARSALVRWAKTEASPVLEEAFVEAAGESVQFRRLAKRYGLGGRGPMKLEDIAKNEGVRWDTIRDSIAAAIRSLPPLPGVEHPGLSALAAETAVSAVEAKFVDDNKLQNGGTPALQHTRTLQTERREIQNVVAVGPGGTSWSSDANSRPSLMDAYTDGWVARFEGSKDTSCPFRNRKLRKKWHQGYREAAQELAARREAAISTS